jgi:hypothetical protein
MPDRYDVTGRQDAGLAGPGMLHECGKPRRAFHVATL